MARILLTGEELLGALALFCVHLGAEFAIAKPGHAASDIRVPRLLRVNELREFGVRRNRRTIHTWTQWIAQQRETLASTYVDDKSIALSLLIATEHGYDAAEALFNGAVPPRIVDADHAARLWDERRTTRIGWVIFAMKMNKRIVRAVEIANIHRAHDEADHDSHASHET